jgi:hypothetical protein
MLITAHHVIRDTKHYKDKNTNEEMILYKSKTFVTFDTDGRFFRKDRDLSKDRRFIECVKVRSNIDNEFPDSYNLKKYLRAELWSFPNDFCFMKFKDRVPSLESVPYCLPIAPDTTSQSLIVGYPGFISVDDFQRKYSRRCWMVLIRRFYHLESHAVLTVRMYSHDC